MTGDATCLVNDLAFARPGDKGNDSDVTVFARSQPAYDHLVLVLTADRVADHYGDLVRGEVTRWEVPRVWALKFLLRDALGGGGPASLRADNLGKALGGAILRMEVPAPGDLVVPQRPPADPYASADWVVD
ncbi:MAG: AtuA-related protein [Euzebya sp.]